MFCVNCGKPVESHFKFCPYCATNISTGKQQNNNNSDFEIVAGKLIKYTGSDVDVIIPDNVVEIGAGAFESLTPLKSVVIPNSVKIIGGCAFAGCRNLTNITIPNSVTDIYGFAFRECVNFTHITIPNSVTKIGSYCFYGCCNLTHIEFPKHFSFHVFEGTAMYIEFTKREEEKRKAKDISNGICPKCRQKLSFWDNKCKRCGVKY